MECAVEDSCHLKIRFGQMAYAQETWDDSVLPVPAAP